MKRFALLFVAVLMLFLAACGAAVEEPTLPPETVPETTQEATVPTTEETVPETTELVIPEPGMTADGIPFYPCTMERTEDGFTVKGYGLDILYTEDRTLTITLGNLQIQDSYTVNLPSSMRGMAEYSWGVKFCHPEMTKSLELSTVYYAHFMQFLDQDSTNMTIGLSSMQTSLYFPSDDSGQFFYLAMISTEEGDMPVPVEISHTADSITWSCTIPQEVLLNDVLTPVDFCYDEYSQFEIFILDSSIDENDPVTVQNVNRYLYIPE